MREEIPGISPAELVKIQKPAQYLGGELNTVIKSDSAVDLNICLAFPDVYEVGTAHIGYQILYDLINRYPNFWAERAFQPHWDMEKLLREKNLKLRSLEAKRPLREFDVLGFSLQYELCSSGILCILDLAGIPLLASERSENDPLVIGGGPVTYHPEPFANFFDAFLIGDGEELVPEFLLKLVELKTQTLSRSEKLRILASIPGVYIPSLFEPTYRPDGTFAGMKSLMEGYTGITRRAIATLENAPFPRAPIVPNIEAVHDRLSVEVMRGCVRGCRFCQAGYLYRPQRERKPEEILDIVKSSLDNSGYEELSLLSLSTADYCSILPLLSALKDRYAQDDQTAISFPSTRVDALKPELLQEVQAVRRTGFTVAPEAGTQRLRDVINKGVTDEEILSMCANVYRLGWTSIKMYFMIGLPTETDEDIFGIVDIARRAKALAGKGQALTVSVSTLVPKPHTPFQWAKQISPEETRRKQAILARELQKIRVKFRYHDADSTHLEGVFARGDRSLSAVLLKAYELGTRLDGWSEELQKTAWEEAFEQLGLHPDKYLQGFQETDPLPWDHISCDIPKRYFLKEWQRATAERTTPDCLTQSCSSCGACDYDSMRNVLFERTSTEKRLNIVDPPWAPIIEARRQEGESAPLVTISANRKEVFASKASSREKTTQEKDNGATYTLKEYLRTEHDVGKSFAPVRSELPPVQRLRCRYSKLGVSKYHGHLELMRIMFRSARRAGIPVAFTKGFHPKPKMSFGPPTQLGVESHCEYVDLFLQEALAPAEFLRRYNAALPQGLSIASAVEVPMKSVSIQASMRGMTLRAKLIGDLPFPEDARTRIQGWRDRSVTRIRKRRRSEVALTELVASVEQADSGEIHVSVNCGEAVPALKPFELVSAITGIEAENFQIVKETALLAG